MKNEPNAAQWSRLDNAAKVFPANSSKADTKVFRFSCELYEPVEEEVLEEALGQTLRFFSPLPVCAPAWLVLALF